MLASSNQLDTGMKAWDGVRDGRLSLVPLEHSKPEISKDTMYLRQKQSLQELNLAWLLAVRTLASHCPSDLCFLSWGREG